MIARSQVGVKALVVVTGFLLIMSSICAVASGQSRHRIRDGGEATTVIPGDVLRLHVLAHSDLPEDQAVKLKVRDAILEELASWPQMSTRTQSEALVLKRQALLAEIALHVVRDEGFAYPVRVQVGPRHFSERVYDDQVFPAGRYPSIVIILGDGAGQNWWCVLFPPLCFIDDEEEEQPPDDVDGLSHQILDQGTNPSLEADFAHDTADPANASAHAPTNTSNEIEWRIRLWDTIAQGVYTERVRAWLKVAWAATPLIDQP